MSERAVVGKVPVAFLHRFDDAENVDTFDQRIGRCYELALRAQLNFVIHKWVTTLVHGGIGPAHNPHAWLEWRDASGKRYAWDGPGDRVMYGRDYQVSHMTEEWSRYNPREASKLFIAADTNGPWGERDLLRAIDRVERMVISGINIKGGKDRLVDLREDLERERKRNGRTK